MYAENEHQLNVDEEGQPITASAHSGIVSLTLRPNKQVYVVAEGITLGFHCQSLEGVLDWAKAMKEAGKKPLQTTVFSTIF